MSIETAGGTSVSSDSRGEDGCHELAGAAHFHVASPAQPYQSCRETSPRGLFLFVRKEVLMERKVLPVRIARSGSAYDISIGAGLLEGTGPWAAKAVGTRKNRVLVISN